MTPTEMEEAIRNLQLQANRIEQFLPNLALRQELHAVRDEVMRHALMLSERTQDKIQILAEAVEDVRARIAAEGELKREIDSLRDQLTLEIGTLQHALSAQIGELTRQVSGLRPRRHKR